MPPAARSPIRTHTVPRHPALGCSPSVVRVGAASLHPQEATSASPPYSPLWSVASAKGRESRVLVLPDAQDDEARGTSNEGVYDGRLVRYTRECTPHRQTRAPCKRNRVCGTGARI